MTRIIAGLARGLPLAVPAKGTRPTSDRVREALFSALESRDLVDGARVLDLYAGSGALGLEAASRGAGEVTLVEKSRDAAALCRRNAERVAAQAPAGSIPVVEVTRQPVQAFLNSAVRAWDLVFIDPPYDLGEAELMHVLDALVPRLAEGGIVMLERSARSPEPAWPDGLEPQRRKDYGETAVYWAERV